MSNIKILKGVQCLDTKFTEFSDGALNCEIKDYKVLEDCSDKIVVQLDVKDCTKDMFKLMLVKDILDNLGCTQVSLNLGYIPNARADRRFSDGSAHPLKVFCKTLNSLNFKKVYVNDPHSDVATSLIDNVSVSTQTQQFKFLDYALERITDNYVLCAPDLGATKKIFDTVLSLGHEEYLQAIKIRDVKTGNIIKCDIKCDHLEGKDVVLLDDLCDFGNSFKYLSKKLKEKGAGRVILYVTHGIFAGGLSVLENDIDYILCGNIVGGYINKEDLRVFNER